MFVFPIYTVLHSRTMQRKMMRQRKVMRIWSITNGERILIKCNEFLSPYIFCSHVFHSWGCTNDLLFHYLRFDERQVLFIYHLLLNCVSIARFTSLRGVISRAMPCQSTAAVRWQWEDKVLIVIKAQAIYSHLHSLPLGISPFPMSLPPFSGK